MAALFEAAITDLRAAGATVVDDFRVPGFEQFPAIAETYPGFDVSAYLGLVVPSATPRTIVRK